MAGFDLDAQRSFTLPGGGRGESGYFDISARSRSIEIPTRLTECYFGQANANLTSTGHSLLATTDCVITAGAITFFRHGQYAQEDVRYYYEVKGW